MAHNLFQFQLSTNFEFYISQTSIFIWRIGHQNDGFIFSCLLHIMVLWLHWLKVKRFSVSAVVCLIFVGSISLLKISLVSLYLKRKKIKKKLHNHNIQLRWLIIIFQILIILIKTKNLRMCLISANGEHTNVKSIWENT